MITKTETRKERMIQRVRTTTLGESIRSKRHTK